MRLSKTRINSTAAAMLLLTLSFLLIASGCASSGSSAAAAVPAAPPPPAAIGSWSLTIDTPQGTQEPTLEIMGAAGALGGKFSGAQGELAIETVSFMDPNLSFSVTIDIGGQELELNFEGTVEGDAINGVFKTIFGDFTTTGTRNQ